MVKVVVAIVVDVEVDVQLPETRFCTSSSFGNIAIYLATVHFTTTEVWSAKHNRKNIPIGYKVE